MPKYYCDYCDTFLTHDSPLGRKTHNEGRKHKDCVRLFYQNWLEAQAQKLVDETARAFEAKRMHGAVPRTTLGMQPAPAVGVYPLMGGPPGMPMMAPPPMFFQGPPPSFSGAPMMPAFHGGPMRHVGAPGMSRMAPYPQQNLHPK